MTRRTDSSGASPGHAHPTGCGAGTFDGIEKDSTYASVYAARDAAQNGAVT